MDFNSNSNDEKQNEKKDKFGILVPYIYIKKALRRIWNFLLKGLSYGFTCKSSFYIIYFYNYFLYWNSYFIRNKK